MCALPVSGRSRQDGGARTHACASIRSSGRRNRAGSSDRVGLQSQLAGSVTWTPCQSGKSVRVSTPVSGTGRPGSSPGSPTIPFLIRTLVGAGPLISEKLKGPPTRSQPKFLRCRLGPAWRSRAGHGVVVRTRVWGARSPGPIPGALTNGESRSGSAPALGAGSPGSIPGFPTNTMKKPV